MASAVPVDIQTAGLLAANMLQCWVASERAVSAHSADGFVSATRQELSEGGG